MSNKRLHESSKRQALREQRIKKQRQQRLMIVGAIAGVVVILAGIAIWLNVILPMLTPVGDFVTPAQNPRPNANLNSTGDPNAPVKILEFSDFQCPYCKMFTTDTEQQLIDTYIKTGKVYLTYIPFGPSGQYIGPESEAAAKAAFCAGDQGKFWEFHDILFANQTGENIGDFTDKRLSAFAKAIRLNTSTFQSCYKSTKYDAKLQNGIDQGIQAGLTGTPSFLVNGKVLQGAQPFSAFKTEIDAALKAAGVN